MSIRASRAKAAGAALFSFAVIGAVCVFGYAALQGDLGLVRLMRLESQEAELRQRLTEIRAERAAMQNLTRRLGDSYLDLDLLDERARAVLGLARTDEIVIR